MASVRLLRAVRIRGGAAYQAGEAIHVDDALARQWVTAGWAVPVSATAAAPAGSDGGLEEGRKALDHPPVDKMQRPGAVKGQRAP